MIKVLDHADAMPGAADLRRASYDVLEIDGAATVVDVGCGTVRAVAEMADRGARVMGVDLDTQMVNLAQRRWPDVEFREASAYALPLADGEVTAYRADKVFHELDDPDRALGEARRVLARGGRIAVVGQDWDAVMIDSDTAELTRRIIAARADVIPRPRAARESRRLLLDAGFTDVMVRGFTAVVTSSELLPLVQGSAETAARISAISPAERDVWIADQHRRAADDRLFVAIPLILTVAKRT